MCVRKTVSCSSIALPCLLLDTQTSRRQQTAPLMPQRSGSAPDQRARARHDSAARRLAQRQRVIFRCRQLYERASIQPAALVTNKPARGAQQSGQRTHAPWSISCCVALVSTTPYARASPSGAPASVDDTKHCSTSQLSASQWPFIAPLWRQRFVAQSRFCAVSGGRTRRTAAHNGARVRRSPLTVLFGRK